MESGKCGGLLGALLFGGGSGGGSGGGIFVPTFTKSNNTWSCDKTLSEIIDACSSGNCAKAFIVGYSSGTDVARLNYFDEDAASKVASFDWVYYNEDEIAVNYIDMFLEQGETVIEYYSLSYTMSAST